MQPDQLEQIYHKRQQARKHYRYALFIGVLWGIVNTDLALVAINIMIISTIVLAMYAVIVILYYNRTVENLRNQWALRMDDIDKTVNPWSTDQINDIENDH